MAHRSPFRPTCPGSPEQPGQPFDLDPRCRRLGTDRGSTLDRTSCLSAAATLGDQAQGQRAVESGVEAPVHHIDPAAAGTLEGPPLHPGRIATALDHDAERDPLVVFDERRKAEIHARGARREPGSPAEHRGQDHLLIPGLQAQLLRVVGTNPHLDAHVVFQPRFELGGTACDQGGAQGRGVIRLPGVHADAAQHGCGAFRAEASLQRRADEAIAHAPDPAAPAGKHDGAGMLVRGPGGQQVCDLPATRFVERTEALVECLERQLEIQVPAVGIRETIAPDGQDATTSRQRPVGPQGHSV